MAGKVSHRLPDLEPEAEAVASQKCRTAAPGRVSIDVSGFSWRVAAQADVSQPLPALWQTHAKRTAGGLGYRAQNMRWSV